MEPKKTNLLNWIIVFVALLAAACVMYWFYHAMNPAEGVKEAEHDKSAIVREIDSLEARRDNSGKQIVKHSQTQAAKSDSLLKTIKNEKTIIRDTTYAAMCEYITNYRQP